MRRYFPTFLPAAIVTLALSLLLFACAAPQAEPTVAPVATTAPASAPPTMMAATPVATATSAPAPATATTLPAATPAPTPAATATPEPAPTEPPPASAGNGVTVFTLGAGAIARYKVEEVLASTGFKIATGETTDVAGSIAFDADGSVVAEGSRISVQAATLRTDSDRRDGYVRRRTLETDTYPEVIFRPTAVDGLPASVADASGPAEFTITGDLTVRDQTREVTWDATADFAGDGTVAGFASVEFTFDDFGMDKPRVAVVLSVEDTILLELDFAGTITGP